MKAGTRGLIAVHYVVCQTAGSTRKQITSMSAMLAIQSGTAGTLQGVVWVPIFIAWAFQTK